MSDIARDATPEQGDRQPAAAAPLQLSREATQQLLREFLHDQETYQRLDQRRQELGEELVRLCVHEPDVDSFLQACSGMTETVPDFSSHIRTIRRRVETTDLEEIKKLDHAIQNPSPRVDSFFDFWNKMIDTFPGFKNWVEDQGKRIGIIQEMTPIVQEWATAFALMNTKSAILRHFALDSTHILPKNIETIDLDEYKIYNPSIVEPTIEVGSEFEQSLLPELPSGPDQAATPTPSAQRSPELVTVYEWKPSQPFAPEWIGKALRTETHDGEMALYGPGSAWVLNQDTRHEIDLLVYPERGVASIGWLDDLEDIHSRNFRRYQVSDLRVRDSDAEGQVIIFAASGDRRTLVTLNSRGEFSERAACVKDAKPTLDEFLARDAAARQATAQPASEPATVGAAEAAKIMGVTKAYVHRLVREGQLPVVKTVGKAMLLDEAAVRRFRRSRRPRS